MFVDAAGREVGNYTDEDEIYVEVIDPTHAGATSLNDVVEIGGVTFGVAPLAGAQNDAFITDGLSLGLAAGDTITATYTDPTDPTDASSDTITIIGCELDVEEFYASPNPFDNEATFGFIGTCSATVMLVEVYDLAGTRVWGQERENVNEITWNGAGCWNGEYRYEVMATNGTRTLNGQGYVFLAREGNDKPGDFTPPEIDISVPRLRQYSLGEEVLVSFTVSDDSGTRVGIQSTSGNGDPLETSVPGWHRLTVIATDASGNQASRDVRYYVRAEKASAGSSSPTRRQLRGHWVGRMGPGNGLGHL